MKTNCQCTSSSCGCAANAADTTATPISRWNRPGLAALRYRVGTHGAFMASMRQRLGAMRVEVDAPDGSHQVYYPLQGLSTREAGDPSMALLDAWASAGDVLSFYQERIANEGYLRTAQERRSVLEMGRLVGYELKPGVAASVFLAYTLDKNQGQSVLLPQGSRAQSIAGPEEMPQSFESSEDTSLRYDWNNLRPRSDAPQDIRLADALNFSELYLSGTNTNLKSGDRILLRFGAAQADATQALLGSDLIDVLRTIAKVEPQAAGGRTRLQMAALPSLQHIVAQLLYVLAQQVSAYLEKHGAPTEYGVKSMVQIVEYAMQQTWFGNLGPVQEVIDNARLWLANGRAQLVPGVESEGVAAVNAGGTATGIVVLAQGTPNPSGSSEGLPDNLLEIRLSSVPLDAALQAALDDFQRDVINAVKADDAGDDDTPDNSNATTPSQFVNRLLMPPVMQARNRQQLTRSLGRAFQRGADLHPQLLLNFAPHLRDHFYNAWNNATLAHNNPALRGVFAMRANLSLFGATSAKPATPDNYKVSQESWGDWKCASDENSKTAWLDAAHEAILDGSLAVISMQGNDPNGRSRPVRASFNVLQATTTQRAQYGLSNKSTRLQLDRSWWSPSTNTDITQLRSVLVLAQSEALPLALAPLTDAVGGQEITLDGLYNELQSGRWIILQGERADITGVAGVQVAELLMISGLRQEYNADLPGDSIHTTLLLATTTAYQYKRDTITIYGNVVKATHGETRTETLGAGNGAVGMQSFTLKQSPLTFVAANTPRGIASTLTVLVDDIAWQETTTLRGSGPNARQYVTKISDDGKTTVSFGNGIDGARLPTGIENVRAVYRQSIGASGNVRAGQISMLMSRPLGVREVINPLRASGGADPESRDQARANVPLAVMALDRLVSLQDYEDFARTFAGIDKALVARVSDGRRELIHLTIAGANDAPIDESSDLYRNLLAALHSFGDPDQPLKVQLRELMLLILNARIALLPGYQWEQVEAAVRQNLLSAFGFAQRALGQAVLLCEVMATIQNTSGVAYVDIDNFGGVPERQAQEDGSRVLLDLDQLALRIAKISHPGEFNENDLQNGVPQVVLANQAGLERTALRPAQLVMFTPDIADTIILNQITGQP